MKSEQENCRIETTSTHKIYDKFQAKRFTISLVSKFSIGFKVTICQSHSKHKISRNH